MWYLVNETYGTRIKNTEKTEAINDYLIELHKIINSVFILNIKLLPEKLNEISKHLYLVKSERRISSKNLIIKNKLQYNFAWEQRDKTAEFLNFSWGSKIHGLAQIITNITKQVQPLIKPPLPPKPNNIIIPPNITPSVSLDETKIEELYNKSNKKRERKIQKDKETQSRNIFRVDKDLYYRIKDELAEDKIKEVPCLFSKKYDIFESMDEEGLLDCDDAYETFMDIFQEEPVTVR